MLKSLHALIRFWKPFENALIGFLFGTSTFSENHTEGQLVLSDLCRSITTNGLTITITVFRWEGEGDWMLEVADGSGDATFWTEPFWSDKQALSAAMKAIGSGSLCSGGNDRAFPALRELWSIRGDGRTTLCAPHPKRATPRSPQR